MRMLLLISLLAVSMIFCAYLTPRPRSQFTASMDVVATSSDSHALGTTSNLWRDSYVRNQYLPYRAESATNGTSRGVLYAKTDGKLYFRNATGTETAIT